MAKKSQEDLRKLYLKHVKKHGENAVAPIEIISAREKLSEVLDEILPPEKPLGEFECPTCRVGLKRSNCGKGFYCTHMIPMDTPCAKCKQERSNRIFWHCQQCGFTKVDVPESIDWRVSLMPRVNGEYLEELDNGDDTA